MGGTGFRDRRTAEKLKATLERPPRGQTTIETRMEASAQSYGTHIGPGAILAYAPPKEDIDPDTAPWRARIHIRGLYLRRPDDMDFPNRLVVASAPCQLVRLVPARKPDVAIAGNWTPEAEANGTWDQAEAELLLELVTRGPAGFDPLTDPSMVRVYNLLPVDILERTLLIIKPIRDGLYYAETIYCTHINPEDFTG